MPLPSLVVTRPQPEAADWVRQLQAQGVHAHAMPLLEIAALPSNCARAAWATALAHLPAYTAWMFVSANAVRHGLAHPHWQHMAVSVLQALPRCWSPGPGTSRALVQAGVDPCHIDAPAAHAPQFDSEALWQQVGTNVHPGDRILILRGADGLQQEPIGSGRAWLADQLKARGAEVDFLPVYTRQPPVPTPLLRQSIMQLHAAPQAWLFSSSECIRNLCALAPDLAWKAHTAITTHPRIALQAQKAGFGHVHCSKPRLQDIVASLESLA